MDENYLEMAERLDSAQRDASVAAASRAAQAESHPNFDGQHCIDCDGEIPAGRLALGRIRCVYCQESRERKNARP
jgi:hypothetical protein